MMMMRAHYDGRSGYNPPAVKMKLQDHDFLWKCYQHFYLPDEIAHPKNLCRFFWVAMLGLVKRIICDFSLFIVLPIGIISATLFFLGFYHFRFESNFISTFFEIFSMMVVIILIITLLRRAYLLIMRALPNSSITVVVYVFFPIALVIYHIVYPQPEFYDQLWNAFVATFCFSAVALICFLLYYFIIRPASMTQAFKTLKVIYSAKKQKICPFIEPPDSWNKDNA